MLVNKIANISGMLSVVTAKSRGRTQTVTPHWDEVGFYHSELKFINTYRPACSVERFLLSVQSCFV
jgi:hypothetical protein